MQSTLNFQELLSSDNTVRTRAESGVQAQFDSNPSQLAQALLTQGMGKDVAQQESILACVLFKKYFFGPLATVQLSDVELEQIKASIEASFDFDNQMMIQLRNKADVLSKIYGRLNQNAQFFRSLSSLFDSENPKAREFAMYGFEVLSEMSLSSEELTAAKGDFMGIFDKALKDTEVTVRIAALKAITAFLSQIKDQDTVMAFASVLPTLLSLVQEALQKDEEKGRGALESMQELTTAHPEVWKSSADQLINTVSQVAAFQEFEEGTRAAAIEVGLALAEEMPATLRKQPEITKAFINSLVSMLKEVESDEATWAETIEATEKVSTDVVTTASSALSRLGEALGEKTILTTCQPLIMEYVKSENWTQRFAGFTLFGLITGTCAKSYSENLQTAIQTASVGVNDSDARVRFAALGALSSLMTFLGPDVQKQFHKELVPEIAKHMANEPLLKMQAQSTTAMLAFCGSLVVDEEDEDESETVDGASIMRMYSSETLNALGTLLEKGITANYEPLQMESLSLISTIAEVIGAEFGQFFVHFMTAFAKIVASEEKDSFKLSAKAIETMGSIISAVSGADDTSAYKASVVEITTKLASMIQSKLSEDDPRDEAIKDTLTQCAAFLGQEFAQFMPMLLEQLLADAKLDLDFKMQSVDETPAGDNPSLRVKVAGLGEQRVSMNTDALVRKVGAFTVLSRVSERMGSAFGQYVEPLLPILYEHVTFEHNKSIKKLALKTLKNCLSATNEQVNIGYFQQAVPSIFAHLEKSLARKDDKTSKIMVKSLADCLRALSRTNANNRQFFTQEQLAQLGPLIKQSLELVGELKQAHKVIIEQTKSTYDIDEEDLEKIKEELAKIGKLGTQCMELTGQLVEIFKDQAAQMVKDASLSYWAALLQDYKNITEEEVLDALCYFCDVVDNTSASQDQDMLVQLSGKYLEILKSSHGEGEFVQHTVAYGLGEFGLFLPKDKFAPFLAEACTLIKTITRRDGAFSEEMISSTENAMGALAKLGYKQMDGSNVTEEELIGVLGQMPFKSDESEAQTSHRLLIEQLLDQSSVVNASPAIKTAAVDALQRIRSHAEAQDENAEVKVLCFAAKSLLQQL